MILTTALKNKRAYQKGDNVVNPNGIMMVEPTRRASDVPLIDEATRKMTAAWRAAKHSDYGYRGFHVCTCGATSDNKDHWVGENSVGEEDKGKNTNSLAIHYLAYHRQDVPVDELEKVLNLTYGEAEPTEDELGTPLKRMRIRI